MDPRPALPLPPAPPRGAPEVDVREVGRVVATVLLAGGSPEPSAWEEANRLLARLGRPALAQRDLTLSTPEELAPQVPPDLRVAVADVLWQLSEGEPLRRRVAASYLALWSLTPPSPRGGEAKAPVATIARWLVGALPRHQDTTLPEERSMTESIYRVDGQQPEIAPAVRDPLRGRVERIGEEARRVVAAVERVLIGKRNVIARVLTALAARGHVLLVDAPGVGKTQMCKAIAAAIGLPFGRVQFTPDLLPMDLTGANIYEAHEKRFVFRPGPVFTSLLLADEINRATPKTQSALLEVMEERTVTVDGVSHAVGEPFQVLATMNPLDHEGTFALPAAQIDRFMIMLELGQLAPEDEVRVLDAHLGAEPVLASVVPVIEARALLEWQETVPLIHASPEVKRAAVDYVHGLRRDPAMAQAVSPRATLAWMRAAQAHAMLSGREFVTVDDLLAVGADVLRHRMGLTAGEVQHRLATVHARPMGVAR